MLRALLSDVGRAADFTAVTLWDARLDPPRFSRVEVIPVAGREVEQKQFRRLAKECEATLLIAPEFAGILAQRRRCVDEMGGRAVGCTVEAIELCADKLRLSQLLSEHGVRTPGTMLLDLERRETPLPFPLVVKPRDGAGSQHTHLVCHAHELRGLRLPKNGWPSEFVCQPYIAGRALSTAAIISDGGRSVRVFPIGAQRLSEDGRFTYLGGEIPAKLPAGRGSVDLGESVGRLVQRVVQCIPGLEGYVGFDLVLPEDQTLEPLLIEVNPRLTTSYVGYHRLATENLAERVMCPNRGTNEIRWGDRRVTFEPDGGLTSPRALGSEPCGT